MLQKLQEPAARIFWVGFAVPVKFCHRNVTGSHRRRSDVGRNGCPAAG